MWKKIDGFSSYEVNDKGEVRSFKRLKTGKILKQNINKHGYAQVGLISDDGKYCTKSVHRLVAETFIPNPNNLETVNHIDEIKTNNSVDNLEWMSGADNTAYSCCTTVFRCNETGQIFNSQSGCARELGLDKRSINHVLKGRVKHTGGLSFSYC